MFFQAKRTLLLGALATCCLWLPSLGFGVPGGGNSIGTMPSMSGGGVLAAAPRPHQTLFLRGTREHILASVFDLQGEAELYLGALFQGSNEIVLEIRGEFQITLDSVLLESGAVEVGALAPTDHPMVAAFEYSGTILPATQVPANGVLDLGIQSWLSAGIPLPPYGVHSVAPVAGRAHHQVIVTPSFVRIIQTKF